MRAAIAALLLLSACSSPQEELSSSWKTLGSWAATAEMVSRGWSRDEIPAPATRDVLRKGGRQLDKLITSTEKNGRFPADQSRRLVASAHSALSLFGEIDRSVESGDRSAAATLAARLQPLAREASAAGDALERGP